MVSEVLLVLAETAWHKGVRRHRTRRTSDGERRLADLPIEVRSARAVGPGHSVVDRVAVEVATPTEPCRQSILFVIEFSNSVPVCRQSAEDLRAVLRPGI